VRPDRYPYETGVVSEQLCPASQLLGEITGVSVQPNKAIIGRNAFAHEAGIHQDGMLKNPLTYEIMTPKSVGVPDSKLVLGKHSGRHALGLRCEQLGYQFDRRELDEVYRRFVVLADQIKHVADHHLLDLIRETRLAPRHSSPETGKTEQGARSGAQLRSKLVKLKNGAPASPQETVPREKPCPERHLGRPHLDFLAQAW